MRLTVLGIPCCSVFRSLGLGMSGIYVIAFWDDPVGPFLTRFTVLQPVLLGI